MHSVLLVSFLAILGSAYAGADPDLAVLGDGSTPSRHGEFETDRPPHPYKQFDDESVAPRRQIPAVSVTPREAGADQDAGPAEYGEPDGREETIVDGRVGEMPGAPYEFENHNPSVTDDGQELFEGDIVLTDEQKADRQALTNLWSGGVVRYTITSSSAADSNVILQAINHWSALVCVRFIAVPISYNSGPHIRFVKQTGCYSQFGSINAIQGQIISIGDGCQTMGIVAHEIGHALGLTHEQSRPDRDTYVTIHWGNIDQNKQSQFAIKNSLNYSLPYDLTSVMHYGPGAFSNNGLPTITAKQLQYTHLMGRQLGLSHRDHQLVNAMYRCSAQCSRPPRCYYRGYVDGHCRCVCPPNTSGTSCQHYLGPYYTVCGNQNIQNPTTITSLNYPSIYPRGRTCFWIAYAPAGRRVRIRFGRAEVLYRYENRCQWDWINLFGDDDTAPGITACGSELQDRTFTSPGRRLAVEMRTYPDGSYPYYQKGFIASVDFV